MIKWMILAFLSFSSIGCSSESVSPHMTYVAVFDNSKIGIVEPVFDDVAKRNNLRIFKKDRMEMQGLSHGKKAFFTALYFHADPVLIIDQCGCVG
jgi:hypothetical protein